MSPKGKAKLIVIGGVFVVMGVAIIGVMVWWFSGGNDPQEVLDATVSQEYQPLIDSVDLERASNPSPNHQKLVGTIDGVEVNIELMYGYKKGMEVARTTIVTEVDGPDEPSVTARDVDSGATFIEAFDANSGDVAHVASCLGEANKEVVAFAAERGGELTLSGRGAQWISRDLSFDGDGEAIVGALVEMAQLAPTIATCR